MHGLADLIFFIFIYFEGGRAVWAKARKCEAPKHCAAARIKERSNWNSSEIILQYTIIEIILYNIVVKQYITTIDMYNIIEM